MGPTIISSFVTLTSQQSTFQVCKDLKESKHNPETKLELSAVKDELQAIRKMLEVHNK